MDRVSSHTLQIKDRLGINEILNCFKDAGFDTYDFTMYGIEYAKDVFIDKSDYIERAKDLRKHADSLGLKCNQTHANFPTIDIKKTEEQNKIEFERAIKSIKITSILGGEICVIHPVAHYSVKENVEFYKLFIPYAKKYNVKIGIENMWFWDNENDHARTAPCSNHNSFAEMLKLIDSEYVVACLDIGHAEMEGLETSAVQMIKALGSKLQALHIHDNDKKHDSHQIPFSGRIDFEQIINALADINYKGDITFECNQWFIKNPQSLFVDSLIELRKIGEYFRDELIKRRAK